jgi:hypothetical protein
MPHGQRVPLEGFKSMGLESSHRVTEKFLLSGAVGKGESGNRSSHDRSHPFLKESQQMKFKEFLQWSE